MEASILIAAIALLILLAVTSMRFGVDSREEFASKERDLGSRGFSWQNSPARDRFIAREAREARERRLSATPA